VKLRTFSCSGFRERVIELPEDEIERSDPGADAFERMFATKADVFLADGFVENASEKMVDLPTAQAGTRRSVALLKQLSNESQARLSGLGTDDANELSASEVAGMRKYKMEESSFVLGVAKRPQSDSVHARDVHRAKILAVSSCSLGTRRKRGVS